MKKIIFSFLAVCSIAQAESTTYKCKKENSFRRVTLTFSDGFSLTEVNGKPFVPPTEPIQPKLVKLSCVDKETREKVALVYSDRSLSELVLVNNLPMIRAVKFPEIDMIRGYFRTEPHVVPTEYQPYLQSLLGTGPYIEGTLEIMRTLYNEYNK